MFEQIKENSPKGWKKFFNWCCNKNLIDKYYWISSISEIKFVSLIGHLFTFFDSVGIRIAVIPHTNGTFRPYLFRKAGKVWTFLELEDYEYGFSARPEAWKAAIQKAFEIYEKILEQSCLSK